MVFTATGTFPNIKCKMTTATTGATIFYTTNGTNPTHNGATATGSTSKYSAPVAIRQCDGSDFAAIAYKSGMTDSDVTSTYMSNMGGACNNAMVGGGGAAKAMAQTQSLVTVTVISVWDGDWALLEEYAQNASLPSQGYVQGYHGLVKTLNDNIYYYQDSLGSTSHVANANGQLLEWYKYDVYGKPKYFDASNSPLQSSNYQVADLGDGGARWMPELGLYDDRNRFMSPELGRFLQPEPIGFKGDASNLYRYCGNDWGNRSDPTGLIGTALDPLWVQVTRERAIDLDEHAIRLGSPAPGAFQAGAQKPGIGQTVTVRGFNAGGPNGQPRDSQPASDSDHQKIYLKRDKIGDTRWKIRATSDKAGSRPLKGYVSFREHRTFDAANSTPGIQHRDITSGWSHLPDNTTIDDVSSGPISGGRGEEHLSYKQNYDVFFNPATPPGPGTIYSTPRNVKTEFQQRYNYKDGAFTGSELTPRDLE